MGIKYTGFKRIYMYFSDELEYPILRTRLSEIKLSAVCIKQE